MIQNSYGSIITVGYTVMGKNTSFLASNVGDLLFIAGVPEVFQVAEIFSDSFLYLSTPVPTLTNAAYMISDSITYNFSFKLPLKGLADNDLALREAFYSLDEKLTDG